MYTDVDERTEPRERALNVLQGYDYDWNDAVRDDGPAMTAAAILLQRDGLLRDAEDMAHAANGAEAAYLDHRRLSVQGHVIPSFARVTQRRDPKADSEVSRELHRADGWRCYLCTRPTLWLVRLKEFDTQSPIVKLYDRMACANLPERQRLCHRRGRPCKSGRHHAPAGFSIATREHVHPRRPAVRSSCWVCQQLKLSRDPERLAEVPGWERLGACLTSSEDALPPWDGDLP